MTDSNFDSQRLNINTVSGTLTKSYKKSLFLRFHIRSNLAGKLLDDNPRYCNRPIVILQVMTCFEGELIVEFIYEEDFNAMFEDTNHERGDI